MKWKKYSAMVIMLGIGFLLSSRVVFAKPSSAYYLDPKTVLGQNNEKYQVYEYKPDSSVNINHPETGENTHKFEDHDVFKDASGKLWLYDSDSKKWNEFVPVVPDVPSTSGSSASNPASVPVPVPVEEIELRGGYNGISGEDHG